MAHSSGYRPQRIETRGGALIIEAQVIGTSQRVLGEEYPSTLTSMANPAFNGPEALLNYSIKVNEIIR